jgi:sulfotransferase famil protein
MNGRQGASVLVDGAWRPQHPATLGLVLPEWKIVYVTTPKVACTSLLRMFASLQEEPMEAACTSLAPEVTRAATVHDFSLWQRTRALQQLGSTEWQEVVRHRDWLICCIARHPVSRLWSAWQSKVLMREPHYAQHYAHRPWFPRIPQRLGDIAVDFRRFIKALQDEDGLIDTDPHWQPQAVLLRVETFPYTHVGRLEELGTTLRLIEKHLRDQGWQGKLSLARENTTVLPLAAARLGSQTVHAIERLYISDLEAFGYSTVASDSVPDKDESEGSVAGQRVRSPTLLVSAVRQVIERNERISDLRDAALTWQRAMRETRPALTVVISAPTAADALTQARRLAVPAGAELVVVLSGPSGEADRQADEVTGARVLRLVSGASLTERLASGIEAGRGDAVLICRHLVAVRAGWWQWLRRALDRPDAGLVTGVLSPSYDSGVTCLGLALTDRVLNCRWVTAPVPEGDMAVPVASTIFAAIRREVLTAAGGIDTGLTGQGVEDVELSLRLWRLGYACTLVPQIRVTADFSTPDVTDRRLFLLNVLRVAITHFSGPNLARVVAALRGDALLPEVLTEVTLSDVGARRAIIERLARHDFSWFLQRFPLDRRGGGGPG